MEIQQLTQSEFAETLKSADNETYLTTFENDAWYEQVTMEEMTYRHKLISLKKLSSELITRKAFEAKPSTEPTRLRAQRNGPVVALVFNTKSTRVLPLAGRHEVRNGQGQALGDLLCQEPPPKKPQTACRNAFGILRSLNYPKCLNSVHDKLGRLVMDLNNTKE